MDQTKPTTIQHLPQEVLYMLMDHLTYQERLNCRLISKHFMSVASYIFKQVKFTSRERIKFFNEALIKNPCIAAHVQTILVKNAALLRAINQESNIKQLCHNVKEIQILLNQGRGSWAQHLSPYPRIQHPPVLMDKKNAKIITQNYKDQIMTLRLGGEYLDGMSRDDIAQLVKSAPKIRTFGLHYLFKEKNRDIHRDLPHTWTFDDLNYLLKQPTMMHRFELSHCEIANRSLIAADKTNMELIRQLRNMCAYPVLLENSLLDSNNHLTHIEMKQIQVTYLTNFVRSILDSYMHLESLDLTFINRNMILEFCVGSQWDMPHPEAWVQDLKPSKLKKLALSTTQSRLNVSQLLEALGKAEAPLQEIAIVDSGDRENTSMDIICEQFSTTLKRLTINCKANFGLARLGSLINLEYASLHWSHTHFDHLVCPSEVLQNSPNITQLEIGYNKCYNGMISRPLNSTYDAFINITSITLDRIIINENEMKEFLLPLTHLKDAIFRRCMFESSKQGGDVNQEEAQDDNDDATAGLDREEMFNFIPSSGDIEDRVRQSFFQGINASNAVQERRNAGENGASNSTAPGHASNAATASSTTARTTTPNNAAAHALTMIRQPNRRRAVRDPSQSKRNNLHIKSLSLEHLGLHDCKLREATGGMANARTIRNFEVIQDKRSGCARTHNIDRAYHEKKDCNPHVNFNKTTETDDTISHHFTHEFGGTTGKNDYINTRPTFKIRLFSVEKLSIRPNCLMSIYFTDKDGGRLKSCQTVVKEQVKAAESNFGILVQRKQQPNQSSSATTAATTSGQNDIDDNYARELRQIFYSGFDINSNQAVATDISDEEKERVSCSAKRQNREIEQVSQLLTHAFSNNTSGGDSAGNTELMALDDTDESTSIFASDIFDSDIFKSVVSSCEYDSSSATVTKLPKNKKTMAIRPF